MTQKGFFRDTRCGAWNADDTERICGTCKFRRVGSILIGVKAAGSAEANRLLLGQYVGYELTWKFTVVATEAFRKADPLARSVAQVAPVSGGVAAVRGSGVAMSDSRSNLRALANAVEDLFPDTRGLLDDEVLGLIAQEAGRELLDAVAQMIPVVREIIAAVRAANNAATLAEKLSNLYAISNATHIANSDNFNSVQHPMLAWLEKQVVIDAGKLMSEIYTLASPGSSLSAPVQSGAKLIVWLAGVGYEALQKKKMNEVLKTPLTKEVLLNYPLLAAEIFSANAHSQFMGIWGDGLGTTSAPAIGQAYEDLAIRQLDTVAAQIRAASRLQIRKIPTTV